MKYKQTKINEISEKEKRNLLKKQNKINGSLTNSFKKSLKSNKKMKTVIEGKTAKQEAEKKKNNERKHIGDTPKSQHRSK